MGVFYRRRVLKNSRSQGIREKVKDENAYIYLLLFLHYMNYRELSPIFVSFSCLACGLLFSGIIATGESTVPGSVKCKRTTASTMKEKENKDQDCTWHFGTCLSVCACVSSFYSKTLKHLLKQV